MGVPQATRPHPIGLRTVLHPHHSSARVPHVFPAHLPPSHSPSSWRRPLLRREVCQRHSHPAPLGASSRTRAPSAASAPLASATRTRWAAADACNPNLCVHITNARTEGTATNPYQAAVGATTCDRCPNGTVSYLGATACTACRPGRVIVSNSASVGWSDFAYSYYGVSFYQGDCVDCAYGTYSNITGATQCTLCPRWEPRTCTSWCLSRNVSNSVL